MHDVRKKEQGVIDLVHALKLTSNHLYPFVEYLTQVVRRDGGTLEFPRFDSVFNGGNKFLFMAFHSVNHEMRFDVRRGLGGYRFVYGRGRFWPFDGFIRHDG